MTIMPRLPTLLAVTVLTAIPLIQAAYAQDVQLRRPADSDDDGTISADEATTDKATRLLRQEYAQLDASHDGTVSQDEVVTARQAQVPKIDTKDNGKITRGEIRARLRNFRP